MHWVRLSRFGMLVAICVLLQMTAVGKAQTQLAARAYLPILVAGPIEVTPAVAPPSPSVTAEPTAYPTADWVQYANAYRSLAKLDPITENPESSRAAFLHSRYMVLEDETTHGERQGSPYYTDEGRLAGGLGGLVYVGEHFQFSSVDAIAQGSIRSLMSGPFHQLLVLSPEVRTAGFGYAIDEEGPLRFASTYTVYKAQRDPLGSFEYPFRYPDDSTVFPTYSFRGGEHPDPITACQDYVYPVGPPLLLSFGSPNPDGGNNIGSTSIVDAIDGSLEHCVYDFESYVNPNASDQRTGRGILSSTGSIVLIPRMPFAQDREISVSIQARGHIYVWSFRTLRFGSVWP